MKIWDAEPRHLSQWEGTKHKFWTQVRFPFVDENLIQSFGFFKERTIF